MKTIQPGILKELLAEAGLDRCRANSKSFVLDCPRCKKKNKLYIRKEDGRFVCWYCRTTENFQGSPEYVFAELGLGLINDLRRRIWGLDGPAADLLLDLDLTDFFGPEDEADALAKAPVEVEWDPDFRDLDSQWGVPGVEYLQKRGVPLELALEYDIKYWPAQRRVVFPVKSSGKLLGWQTRIIDPHEYIDENGEIVKTPKALTYIGLKRDRILMFGDRVTGRKHMVLTEGPMDAIKAHMCGGNVATLGKTISYNQLALIRNSGIERLYLGLDPDAAPEAQKLVEEFYGDIEIYDMRPPSGDIGAMDYQDVYELFKNAPRVNPGTLFIYVKRPHGA
jgi:phage FluMu protein Com